MGDISLWFLSTFINQGQTSALLFSVHMAPVEKSSPKWTFMQALGLDEDDELHQDLYNAMKVSGEAHGQGQSHSVPS